MEKIKQKRIFEKFIRTRSPLNSEEILEKFQVYLELLFIENEKVNLFSRKTSKEDFWTIHFLDSVLPIQHFNFSNKIVLDFGSGGGLPGIPLKLIYPSAEVYLLDSTHKKIRAVKNIVKKLDLKGCFTIVSRLENLDKKWENYFDIIVCRAVRILPEYKKAMFKLLKNDGSILIYKSKKLDDIKQFSSVRFYDLSHPEIGERQIVEIKKE